MDDWKQFNETLLSEKEGFYSLLNMKILLMQTMCTQKVSVKNFEMKCLVEYHDLYIQSNTFLLADVFENFRNMS